MIKSFPEYYQILLDEIYRHRADGKNSEKRICEKMDRFRKTLQHRKGSDVNYSEEQAFLYTLYFWPVNFFKFYYFLEMLDEKTDIFSREKISIGDIGCGTGGFFTALVFYLNLKKKDIKIDYTGFDLSTENLKFFRKYFFSQDFRRFIGFPVKFNTYSGDFLEIRKFPKKDLIIISNVYTELSEEQQDIFWNRVPNLVKKDEQSIIVINEPVSRKSNSRFHTRCRGFLFENSDFSELAPNQMEGQSDESAVSDYFETLIFESPDLWEKLHIKKDDCDFVYRIFTNRKTEKDIKARNIKQKLIEDEIIDFTCSLMTKDIYRKPKPPWRFKITDGINGIDLSDLLVNDERQYADLMQSRIGDIFSVTGLVIREKNKKNKSRYAIQVEKIEKMS